MSRSETLLSVTAGVYLALVLVPLAALLSASAGAAVPGLVGLLTAGVVATLGGTAVAAGVDDLYARLASPLLGSTVVGAPLAFLSAFLLGEPSGTLAGLTVAGVGASAVGVMLLIVAAVVRSQRRLAAATEYVSVESGDDDGRSWENSAQLAAGLFTLLAFLVTAGVSLLHGGLGDGLTLFTGLGGVGTTAVALFDDDTTEVTVTDEGVAVDHLFYAADRLESYRVTDDKLEVERSGFRPKLKVDREEFDEERFDRLVEHLDRIVDPAEGEADGRGGFGSGEGDDRHSLFGGGTTDDERSLFGETTDDDEERHRLFERTTDDGDESFGGTVDDWLRGDDTDPASDADSRERARE